MSTLSFGDLTGDYTGRRKLNELVLPERFGPLGGKKVYFYTPITIEERVEARKRIAYSTDGTMSIDEEGVVEGLMARLRNENGQRIFFAQHRKELMSMMDAELLSWLWQSIGGIGVGGDLAEAVEVQKKG